MRRPTRGDGRGVVEGIADPWEVPSDDLGVGVGMLDRSA